MASSESQTSTGSTTFHFRRLLQYPPDVPIQRYTSACHCGKFAFNFAHPDISQVKVVSCNCSICSIKGLLNIYAASDKLEFTAGSLEEMTAYRFADRVAPHYFCPVCGCGLLAVVQPEDVAVVNVRAVAGVDLEKLTLRHFDGASM